MTMYDVDNIQFMTTIINKKMSGGLAKLEESKIANPDLSSELDKKIAALKERMKIFQDPQKTQDEALAKMMPVLDRLEERLGRAQFVCGRPTAWPTVCTPAPSPGSPWWGCWTTSSPRDPG